MRIRSLGWAGVEIHAGDKTAVIDPLADPAAVFTWLNRDDIPLPAVVPADTAATVGLVTHMHRDHADAGALKRTLAPGAPLFGPAPGGGTRVEELGVALAEAEFEAAGLERRVLEPWQTVEAGGFSVTALPAVDASGDPQASWVVAADGARVIHCGDTMFHGYWWRAALRHGPFDAALLPVNGAVLDFPHRQPPSPLPAVMAPDQAALAGELLAARVVVPIHYGGYAIEPVYRPVADADKRFADAAAGRPYETRILAVGETIELA